MAAEPGNQNTCYRCGSRLGFVRIGTSEGVQSGWSCWCCGNWDQHVERPVPRRQAPQRLDALAPCAVVGCKNFVLISETRNYRCHCCNRLMAEYERGKMTKAAPLIMVAGVWIFNPDRKPRKSKEEKS